MNPQGVRPPLSIQSSIERTQQLHPSNQNTLCKHMHAYTHTHTERERERQRHTHTHTERERDKDTHTHTHTHRERETNGQACMYIKPTHAESYTQNCESVIIQCLGPPS